MSLSSQLSSFFGDVTASANKVTQKRGLGSSSVNQPSPAASNPSANGKIDLKRKRPEQNHVVYSQPQDTGTGRHLMTQVTYAVEYLKSKDRAITFKDIFDFLSIQEIDEQGKRTLEHILQRHPKIEYEKAGSNGKGSYRFRPTHNVRSADELEAFLQQRPTAQGIKVSELKDGWPGAIDAIDSLEADGKLLVTRNKKDHTPRMVWPNDKSLVHPVDVEFQSIWHQRKLPGDNSDLRKALIDFGLTPTSQVKAPQTSNKAKDKKKKAPRKGGKTTNTHMQNILKDFSHLRK